MNGRIAIAKTVKEEFTSLRRSPVPRLKEGRIFDAGGNRLPPPPSSVFSGFIGSAAGMVLPILSCVSLVLLGKTKVPNLFSK